MTDLSETHLISAYPDAVTGDYNFVVGPGNTGLFIPHQAIIRSASIPLLYWIILQRVIEIEDIILDTNSPASRQYAYEKIDLSDIPEVTAVDPSILYQESSGP